MNGTKWEDFGFKSFIEKAIEHKGFAEPTEIQRKMIPLVLRGKALSDSRRRERGKHMLMCCRFCKKQTRLLRKSRR